MRDPACISTFRSSAGRTWLTDVTSSDTVWVSRLGAGEYLEVIIQKRKQLSSEKVTALKVD